MASEDFEAILGLAALRRGWARVQENDGACGADRVAVGDFAARVETELTTLASELAAGGYRPHPLRPAMIPKPDGGRRRLLIPTVRDRVAQTAAASWLTRTLDPSFSNGSFAYRPRRGVADALTALEAAWAQGDAWTLDADIHRFFDEVPHVLLRVDLRRRLPEHRRLRAVLNRWIAGFGRFGRGLAQGSPVSPVLANLFLDPLDRTFETCGAPLIRYADDFVAPLASEEEGRQAMALAGAALRRRGLRLAPAKTALRAPGEAFVFLGRTMSAPCR
jgi:CRISPR-associated protein Cas1